MEPVKENGGRSGYKAAEMNPANHADDIEVERYEHQKVAVLGAGAVGSYVIWGLSARRDIELGVVADGPRGERLVKEGCAINGKVYRPAVWTPQEAHDADLLIVCLKYGALPGALDSIKAVTGPRTTIMSLMNGVDSEDIIASAVGGEHLLYSLIKVASHKEADGVHFDPATTVGIIFGEKEPPCDSPRVKAVEALFGGTELHFRATDCIRGRDVEQVPPQRLQQSAPGHPRRRP